MVVLDSAMPGWLGTVGGGRGRRIHGVTIARSRSFAHNSHDLIVLGPLSLGVLVAVLRERACLLDARRVGLQAPIGPLTVSLAGPLE